MKNLLFITTDQQRRDFLPCYGANFMMTPHFDQLASGGMTFNNGYAVSPVCQPARAAFVSGQYPSVCRVTDNFRWIRAGTPTIADHFNRAGWDTAAIGKMHFYPWDNPEGFRYRVSAEDKRHYYLPDDWSKFLAKNGYRKEHPARFQEYLDSRGAYVNPLPEEMNVDTFIGDEAVKWIKSKKRGENPFFSWISFNSPHDPYDPPAKYADLCNSAAVPAPVKSRIPFSEKPEYQVKNIDFYNKNLLFLIDLSDLDEETVMKWRRYYCANILLIDKQIGRIMAALEESGLIDNTVIVFTSDHGDLLGDHGLPFKSSFYKGCIDIPLIVSGPGITGGTRNSSYVNFVDLHRTFLSLAGIEIPAHVQGIDISPVFSDPSLCLNDRMYAEYKGCAMTATADYKLVLCDNGEGELYDLKNDPDETVNYFSDESYREIRAEMTVRLTSQILKNIENFSFGGGRHPAIPLREEYFNKIRSGAIALACQQKGMP